VPDIYLGLDPGASGGMAAITEGLNGPKVIDLFPLKGRGGKPRPYKEVHRWLRWQTSHNPVRACVEKVGGYISRNPEQRGHQAGVLTRWAGALEMALVSLDIYYEAVPPQRWQAHFNLTRVKEERTSKWKGRLADKAREIFPSAHITLATGDALLLARYCQWVHTRPDEMVPPSEPTYA